MSTVADITVHGKEKASLEGEFNHSSDPVYASGLYITIYDSKHQKTILLFGFFGFSFHRPDIMYIYRWIVIS